MEKAVELLQNEERYIINFQNEISKLGTFREDLGTYDRECNEGLADLKEMMSIVLNAVKQLSDEGWSSRMNMNRGACSTV